MLRKSDSHTLMLSFTIMIEEILELPIFKILSILIVFLESTIIFVKPFQNIS